MAYDQLHPSDSMLSGIPSHATFVLCVLSSIIQVQSKKEVTISQVCYNIGFFDTN
jgi:hypothetical protein